MNDILHDIEEAKLHTYNTIDIITSLEDTITKLGQDDDTSDIEFAQFEKDSKYLKKLAEKIAVDLTPPAPNSSSISFVKKFNSIKSKSNGINSSPKFIQAKPKKMMREKSQQTCDRKTTKAHQDGTKNKHESITTHHHKKLKSKKEVEPAQIVPKAFSNIVFQKDPFLKPTKYLQHILIPIGKVDFKNFSTQSMPNNWQHAGSNFIHQNKYCEEPFEKKYSKQLMKRPSGVEHFTRMMQLCMDVKEERESELAKQIYTLEEEMQTVLKSNKHLYCALEKLEEQNAKTILLKDSFTNTLTDVTLSDKADTLSELPLDQPTYLTSEQITNKLTEDIIKCIHIDIQEIHSDIAETESQNKLIEQEKIGKHKSVYVKHVSFLENAIASMQNKLETAQHKQFELAIQSKAVVEAAHRMTNEPWTY